LEELHIDEKFMERELNVWFSGWEKRKIEILQMKLIWPKYIILDEIDSGLDLDAFRTIAEMLKDLSSKDNSLIIITHYFKILEYINVDKVYVMKDWNIVKNGNKELIKEISESGFTNL
jgi:Fe-S cluster assembly ATP-binding protein